MEMIFAGLTIFCLVYFGMVVMYSGITTSFVWIWIFLAVVHAVAWGMVHYLKKRGPDARLFLPTAFFTTYLLGVLIVVALMFVIVTAAGRKAEPGMDYVIVLGAKVDENGIGKSLKSRLDAAVEYAGKNPNTVFVLSGGRGKHEPVPEAMAMYSYMIRQGVPGDRLLMEFESRSTYENIKNSREEIEHDLAAKKKMLPRFDQRGYLLPPPHREIKIGILTSRFHVFRAINIAKKQGLEHLYPISAPTDRVLMLHLYFREAVAVFKDRIIGRI